MAVLTQSINDGFAQITTLLKQVNTTLKGNQGDLTKLSTADKTSLVNALNELKTSIDNKTSIDDSKAEIGDINTNFVTTINTTYNS